MKKCGVIFESPKWWHQAIMWYYLQRNVSIWVIEPFHTYHYLNHKIAWYPDPLPSCVEGLIEEGKISIIKAKEFKAEEIKMLAEERAVASVEAVFLAYKKKYVRIIEFVCKVTNSLEAEDVFKKRLCEDLGIFYSMNIFMERISQLHALHSIRFYPDVNILEYFHLRRWVAKSRKEFYMHSKIRFPFFVYLAGLIKKVKEKFLIMSKLIGQMVVSLFVNEDSSVKGQKHYKYGVIIQSSRQLRGTQRGPGFFIDNDEIKDEDVVYFLQVKLNRFQKEKLLKEFVRKR